MESRYGLPVSNPDTEGINASAFESFVETARDMRLNLHSFVCLKNGKLIAEYYNDPWTPQMPHSINSISKSFTSTAIGLLEQEGRLTLGDRLIDFFPDKSGIITDEKMREVTLYHLLTMSCGLSKDPDYRRPLLDAFLQSALPYRPGNRFAYSTLGIYVLSHIVTRITGQSLYDYLKPRLFEPLGFGESFWDSYDVPGISAGGIGLHITVSDLAKFGQLYLNKGEWNSKRLLSASWTERASAKHISTEDNKRSGWRFGYGMQFWRWRQGFGCYGVYGQMLYILPCQNLVFAVMGCDEDVQGISDVFFSTIVPACDNAAGGVAQGAGSAPWEGHGLYMDYLDKTPDIENMTVSLDDNPIGLKELSIAHTDDALEVCINRAGKVCAGFSRWTKTEPPFFFAQSPCYSRYAMSEDRLELLFHATVANTTYRLTLDFHANQAFGVFTPAEANEGNMARIGFTVKK